MGRGKNSTVNFKTAGSFKLDAKEVLIKGRLTDSSSYSRQPRMIKVTSSNLEAVGYNRNNKELHITFKSSNKNKKHGYYSDVDLEIYKDLMAADSKGKFLRKNLGGNYDWNYLKPEEVS